ncbi:carbon monoxide dehydrogenase subunit G [Croceicoccus sp. BE223]|uniref:CoxG family protein n=1 Tax=Croceicoccus sp. BE223 TaxID=2817716 RepID=UPI002865E2C1|nr:carbon monoxide dehydrogenase subunit G [Croceicoccus sp. BE223]MDR7103651.1 carbon monoxide dehydrogenase subunit G [Croceicoccus sp. BE223]
MAFKMDGEFVLPATREEVWAGLNDPEVLCRCIQGCQKMERVGDNSFAAEVKMKIGPVTSVFAGKVDLLDLDPPNGYRIEGRGDGGAAGFAKGGAVVTLADAEGGTRLRYDVNADIGGRLAQLGGRLINGVAKRQADQFFMNFAATFEGEAMAPLAAGTATAAATPDAVPVAAAAPIAAPAAVSHVPAYHAPAPLPAAPWAWLVALAVAVLAGFLLGRSNVADWGVIAMILLALVSAGAGFTAGRNR